MTIATNSPEEVRIEVTGVNSKLAVGLKRLVESVINTSGKQFNLDGLDGVSLTGEYESALLSLDRGYATEHQLTPSNEYGYGIAMSPRVMRGGILRNHVIINAHALFSFLENDQPHRVVNAIAHELAHVEITRLFDRNFPGFLLSRKMDVLDAFRWDVTLACWDEYAACWRSAVFGPTSPEEYELSFLEALANVRPKANASITSYRLHGEVPRVVKEVCSQYGNLLKYAAYHLGNLEGHGLPWQNMPNTVREIEGHWFLPYFEALEVACKALKDSYGNWESKILFEAIGDIAEQIVADNGMEFYRHDTGVGLDIPLTPETTPANHLM